MKLSKIIQLKKSTLEKLEKQLEELIYKAYYKSLIDYIATSKNEKMNAIEGSIFAIVGALRAGKISYDGKKFIAKDTFGVKVLKELRALKAKQKAGGYVIDFDAIEPSLAGTLKAEIATAKFKTDATIKFLSQYTVEPHVISTIDDRIINEAIEEISEQAREAYSVQFEYTQENKKFFRDTYIKNAELYSKKLVAKSNERLKKMVADVQASENLTNDALAQKVMQEFGIASRHARFIARQEAGIVRERMNQSAGQALGFNKYVWQTVGDARVRPEDGDNSFMGDNHRRLNGKIFSFDEPPIVDMLTGRRCHPREDYGCRCTARIIVDDKYYEPKPN